MRQARARAAWEQLEGVEVECTHCGVRMTAHSGARVRYFRCSGCHRWVSSVYTDVLRADAHMRTHRVTETPEQTQAFGDVKDRLERWLAAVDEKDPYRELGVSPLDTPEVVRARFHALALERHPDRGGSVEQMQALNAAYERILRHRQRKRMEALSAGTPAAWEGDASLPARAR